MLKAPFMWKAEWGSAPNSAFSAQLDKVTYHVAASYRQILVTEGIRRQRLELAV